MQSNEMACNHFLVLALKLLLLHCNLSSNVALYVWFTTNGVCAKNNRYIYTWREQAIIREIVTHGLYCCMLPQCEALRTCCSGFSNRNSSKCNNVTVDTILPSRSTIKKKLYDKCKLVKVILAKEKQKAIANSGLELSSHTVLVEQNSIFPLFDLSYNNEKCNLFF